MIKNFNISILILLLSSPLLKSQPASNIWMFQVKEGQLSGEPVKVTDRKEYDNQPQFGDDIIYYTSQRGNQTDIWAYDTSSDTTFHITDTPESEYSPTPTPDGLFVSCIMVEKDSSQRLWKYHLHRRHREVVLIDLKPIGYHVWYGNYDLGLFVLGDPNHLYIANGFNGRSTESIPDIGRSLNTIPGMPGHFSFIKNNANMADKVFVSDGITHEPIMDLPANTQDFNWLNDSTLITGVGPKLMTGKIGNRNWSTWADLSNYGIKNISRIAFNRRRDKIAIVVEE